MNEAGNSASFSAETVPVNGSAGMSFGNETRNTLIKVEDNLDTAYAENAFVYFVTNGELVKIGYSKDPERRAFEIQQLSPVPIRLLGYFPGTVALERTIHARFDHLRRHSEWFEFDDEIQDYIDELSGKKPAPVAVITGYPEPPVATAAKIGREWRRWLADRDPPEGQAALDADNIRSAIQEYGGNFRKAAGELSRKNLLDRIAAYKARYALAAD